MEDRMRRYLLGSSPEQEQLELEERLFSDEDLYAELQALESELRYDYAEGKLTGEERRQFEQRFLARAGEPGKVAVAKAVLDRAYARAAAERAPAEAWWKRWWAGPAGALRWAPVAAAVATVFSGWALYQLNRTQERLEQAQARYQDEQRSFTRQLEDERNRRAGLEKQLAERPSAAAAPAPAPLRFLAFALTAGLTRDVDSTKRLVIPAATDEVRFELPVRAGSARYRVALTDPDGNRLFSQTLVAGNPLRFTVPGRVLRPGDYIIEAEGIGAGSAAVPAGDFAFTVARER